MACKQPWWLQIGCEVCARVNNKTVLADLQHMLDWEVIPHQCVTRKLEEEEEVPGYFRCVRFFNTLMRLLNLSHVNKSFLFRLHPIYQKKSQFKNKFLGPWQRRFGKIFYFTNVETLEKGTKQYEINNLTNNLPKTCISSPYMQIWYLYAEVVERYFQQLYFPFSLIEQQVAGQHFSDFSPKSSTRGLFAGSVSVIRIKCFISLLSQRGNINAGGGAVAGELRRGENPKCSKRDWRLARVVAPPLQKPSLC